MTEALVIRKGYKIQCLCERKECYVKKPFYDDYLRDKDKRTIYNNVCKFDDTLSYMSNNELLALYEEDGDIDCISSIWDYGRDVNLAFLKVINLLIHKNKSWIYFYLHENPTLYTSRISGDVLHLITEYVSKY